MQRKIRKSEANTCERVGNASTPTRASNAYLKIESWQFLSNRLPAGKSALGRHVNRETWKFHAEIPSRWLLRSNMCRKTTFFMKIDGRKTLRFWLKLWNMISKIMDAKFQNPFLQSGANENTSCRSRRNSMLKNAPSRCQRCRYSRERVLQSSWKT